jgi:hypothetical protein
MERESMEGERE